jgi:molecular chaperone HscB
MNYFDFFSLQKQFDINQDELETKYLAIQQASHPDKLINKSAKERFTALNRSVEANNAYFTLKDPLSRAKYLLSLDNINIDQEIRHSIPQELLQQSFIDREILEDTDNVEDLNDLLNKTKEAILLIQQDLIKDFNSKDSKNAIIQTIKLQYKTKLLLEIKTKIKKIR